LLFSATIWNRNISVTASDEGCQDRKGDLQKQPLQVQEKKKKLCNYSKVDLFSLVLSSQIYRPSENLKFKIFGIFQSLKFLFFNGKSPFIFSRAKFYSKYFGLLWV